MPAPTELARLAARYDLVIVGGGITGAGILREAVRSGASVLLVEQNDFASGTSCGSSKLVHGGLRYLKNGQWRLTLESVRERRRLLDEAAGLVLPQPFLMPLYRGMRPGRLTMQAGLALYDLMAGQRRSRFVSASEVLKLEPHIRSEGLLGAMAYEDAQTDDARLVLRLIFESVAAGAVALNYVSAQLRSDGARVVGVSLREAQSGEEREIDAGLVINATGPWAGAVPGAPPGAPVLRPLRGSHFVFARETLPVTCAVSWLHPRDHRPIFAYPWEGAVVYGTTDLDHDGSFAPSLSADESAYLFDGLHHQFPGLKLGPADIVSTYSGVRPVVASGGGDPSAESRESAQWSSPGLIGITGGKLTTFRVTARDVLRAAAKQQPRLRPSGDAPVFADCAASPDRLSGRLGERAARALDNAVTERAPLGNSPYTLAELRWSARFEAVRHLDDLLLRRTRLGLVVRDGGAALLPQVEPICRDELGWDAARFAAESARYRELWNRRHAPPAV